MTGSLLTVPQLAELLQVSADWVYTQVEAGALPHTRLGKKLIRFTDEHVTQILDGGDRPPTAVPTISLAKERARRRRSVA